MAEPRKRDAERTKAAVLDAAADEFAKNGFAAARVDEIAERVGITKRLVFYYFQTKEQLYIATLEEAYRRIRDCENALENPAVAPRKALQDICTFTFDYYVEHPSFVRLVASENIEGGAFLAKSNIAKETNGGIIRLIDSVLKRGIDDGTFRADITAIDIHMTISSLAFFVIANRHTFGTLFSVDMVAQSFRAHKRAQIVDIVDRFVRPL